jgi:hypothetical protein
LSAFSFTNHRADHPLAFVFHALLGNHLFIPEFEWLIATI